MITVADAVHKELLASSTALEAMRLGVLNLRAFAKNIQPHIEEQTFKTVKLGTIVVALSRIASSLSTIQTLLPVVYVDEITIKSQLIDITFEKTKENLNRMHSFSKQLEKTEGYFFTVTQGVNEITFIVSDDLKERLLTHFRQQPKAEFEDLVGVNVRFSDTYISEPNIVYAILHKLAIRRVNVLEIVSTYTELTMIIARKEMEDAITELNTLFKRN